MALRKVGKARPFVNPKMVRVISPLLAKLPPSSAMTLPSHLGRMRMSKMKTRPRVGSGEMHYDNALLQDLVIVPGQWKSSLSPLFPPGFAKTIKIVEP
jgi:hypothetical protein